MRLPPTERERVWEDIPWLLFLFLASILFPVYNAFGGASYPWDDPSLTAIERVTESGDPINRIVITALGLIGVWLLVRNRGKIRLQSVIATLLLALLGWSAMSALWSTDPFITDRRLISFALMTIFAGGCAAHMSGFSLSLFITSIPTVGLIIGAAFEVLIGRFHPWTREYRFCGTAPHPNVEASFLSVTVIVLGWLCWQTRGAVRGRFVLATLIVGAFLILTGSRTSFIGVVAALSFSLALIFLRDYKPLVPVLIASLTLAVAAGAIINLTVSGEATQSPFATALHRVDDEGNLTELSGRVDLWKSLMFYVGRRPWSGYGFGAFWSPERIEDVSTELKWVIQQSHSGYIDELLALGIPGALLYIVLLCYCFGWSALQFMRYRDGYGVWAAVLLFIAVHNVSESLSVSSSFTNLTFYLIVLHMAMRLPERSDFATRQEI
jgi:O-antigen ligase